MNIALWLFAWLLLALLVGLIVGPLIYKSGEEQEPQ